MSYLERKNRLKNLKHRHMVSQSSIDKLSETSNSHSSISFLNPVNNIENSEDEALQLIS